MGSERTVGGGDKEEVRQIWRQKVMKNTEKLNFEMNEEQLDFFRWEFI